MIWSRMGRATVLFLVILHLLISGCTSGSAAPPAPLPEVASPRAKPPQPPAPVVMKPVDVKPPPTITTFDNLDLEWKPVFKVPTEIVWKGKVVRATGTKKRLNSKPCTLSLRGEAGVHSQLFVRCGEELIYNSKQKAGGGFFAYAFTMVERIPESTSSPYRYRLAYNDTGSRPNRPQAKISTGIDAKIFGEDPPDFTVDIRFNELSDPRSKEALFRPKKPIPRAYRQEISVTHVSGQDDLKPEDRCTLGLVPYAVDTDGDLWCLAQLTCGKQMLYGNSNGETEGRITPCKSDAQGGALIGSSDDYNRFYSSFPKLTVQLESGLAFLEKETSSVTFSTQTAEQMPTAAGN